ncbi:MAG TPA: ArsR family transcriptional regulator [Ktedonosporobacter sp.]|jgi:predicted ArsR family transcriptional regulator|nr:ArsR family transcriptional regulator [Ktedonosporobacter sp.]
MATNWNQRFFASTRGRIITLLRRASRTVDELAQALGLTDNAVRAHLNTLERDGFVQQRGARRGNSKPSYVYDLTPAAEQLYPKAYGAVLQQLLTVLSTSLPPEELETVLRQTGRNIAARWSNPSDDLRERLQVAVNVLNELGGMAELERSNGGYCIQGYKCPLAIAAQEHPEVCRLAESLLTELVGVPLQEQCEHGETPRCRFVVSSYDG